MVYINSHEYNWVFDVAWKFGVICCSRRFHVSVTIRIQTVSVRFSANQCQDAEIKPDWFPVPFAWLFRRDTRNAWSCRDELDKTIESSSTSNMLFALFPLCSRLAPVLLFCIIFFIWFLLKVLPVAELESKGIASVSVSAAKVGHSLPGIYQWFALFEWNFDLTPLWPTTCCILRSCFLFDSLEVWSR